MKGTVEGGLLTERPAHVLVIHSVDSAGQSFANAAVWRVDCTPPEFLGNTDDVGELLADLPVNLVLELQAVRGAYLSPPSGFTVDESMSSVNLRLEQSAQIKGHVLMPDGSTAGAGVSVAAFRKDQLLTREIAQAVFYRKVLGRVVKTDATGSFTMDRLIAGEGYTLTAGGKGLINSSPLRAVAAGASGVELDVQFGYFGAVRVVDREGGLPIISKDLAVGYGGRIGFPEGLDVHGVMGITVGSFLAGATPLGKMKQSKSDQLVIAVANKAYQEVGPVSISFDVPGFDHMFGEFWLSPIGGELLYYDFFLAPSTAGFGSLEIVFSGIATDLLASEGAPAWGVATLRDDSGSKSYSIGRLAAESVLIEDIPFGVYELGVTANKGIADLRARTGGGQEVVIGDEPFVARIDASHWGGLELTIQRVDSSPYLGPLDVLVAPQSENSSTGDGFITSGGTSVHFDRAPYAIKGLPEQVYIVFMMGPFRNRDGAIDVAVRAGAVSGALLRERK